MPTKKLNKQDNGLSKRSPHYNKFPPNQGFGLVRKTTPRKTDIDQFCIQCCKKLREFVKKKKWVPVSTSVNKWGHQVRKLRDSLKSPDAEQTITIVLDKYLFLSQSIGFVPDKIGGFPKCKDMAQFRRCWDWINNVITKHERDNPVNVTVSDQAKSIATILKRKSWPTGCLDKLEMAVQVSLDNFKNFAHDVKMDCDFYITDPSLKAFYNNVRQKLSSPGQFITDWFESVHKRVVDWPDWNGNLMLEVFKPESKAFHKWGKSVSVAWSGKTDLWYKLSERLGIKS